MDRKTKWRTFWLGLLVVLAVCTLLPSVAPKGTLPPWFTGVFNKRVQLGLDLQGGLHVTYSLDLDRAVEDKATELKREFEASLEDLKVKGTVANRQPRGSIDIIVDDAKDAARIKADTFLKDYNEFLNKVECPAEIKDRGLCVRVSTDFAERVKKQALKQAVETIRERINERGVAEPSVREKNDQIIVELPGLDREAIKRVKDIIKRTAKLEFKMVIESPQGTPGEGGREYTVMENIYRFVGQDDEARRSKKRTITRDLDTWSHDEPQMSYQLPYLRAVDTEEAMTEEQAAAKNKDGCKETAEEGQVLCNITGREILEEYLASVWKRRPDLKMPADLEIGYELVKPRTKESKEEPYWRTYVLKNQVEIGGSAIRRAYVGFDQQTGRPEVYIDFNRYGGRRFAEITSANIGKRFAIILDDKVNSAPTIQSAITGGSARITVGGSSQAEMQTEAEDLVGVLQTGALPAPLKQDSESEVGALLGADAIDKAKVSFGLGSLLVLFIMIGYYRVSGFISIVALVLNLTFMMAILAGFQATLTLPGIAALVLTVGMAVDANIIIYERIREELRAGKSVRGAVDAGFSRGLAAIIDGNLTTGVAAYVLYNFGSGPIKGFAVMLLIGIVCTLFTATWCTRLFFEYYVGRGKNKQLAI